MMEFPDKTICALAVSAKKGGKVRTDVPKLEGIVDARVAALSSSKVRIHGEDDEITWLRE